MGGMSKSGINSHGEKIPAAFRKAELARLLHYLNIAPDAHLGLTWNIYFPKRLALIL
jgi:hypothetical protein